jgi:hypothetical protein
MEPPGGEMDSLCHEALKQVRLCVATTRERLPVANADLIQLGAQPFVPDAAGSNCDLLLVTAACLSNTSQEMI